MTCVTWGLAAGNNRYMKQVIWFGKAKFSRRFSFRNRCTYVAMRDGIPVERMHVNK